MRVGSPSDVDLAEVRRALEIFTDRGPAFEIRGLHGPGKAHGKVCRTIEDGVSAAVDCDRCLVTWLVLNPIRDDARSATKATVVRRRWFLVDIDTVHPDNCSSSDDEKAAAGDVMGRVADYLAGLGWPEPVVDDSGNGWHLLYRLDLPNDELVYQAIRLATVALADRFDCDEAKIDRRTFDAPRCCKLPGTWVRKDPELPDRPHRMARIVRVPEDIGVVTYEQLLALAAVPAIGTNGSVPAAPSEPVRTNGQAATVPLWNVPHTADARAAKIVARAIAGEAGLVANAREGTRNNQLNDSAVALGSLASWPEMNEAFAKDELTRAACRAGLDADTGCGPAGIAATIESGWNHGASVPRPRPDDAKATNGNGHANGNGKVDAKARVRANIPLTGRVTVGADEIEPEDVTWLWQDILALGFINLFAGRTGVGKSFVLCDVAARLSTGRGFADGRPTRPVNGSLFISEDPYRYVLIPRIIELAGDRSRIGFLHWKLLADYELSDIELLQQAWEERGKPELIVIDPPANFLGGKDEHRNAEVRGVLMKLVEWLEGKPVAIALITHYNKGSAQKALDSLDRIMGSVAWSSSARVACGFIADPSEPSQCIFGGIKNNLGEKAKPLSYRIAKSGKQAKVQWLGKSQTTLDEAMAQSSNKRVDGAQYLINQFRIRLEWDADDIIRGALKCGISERTLRDIKRGMSIESEDIRNSKGHIVGHRWRVPAHWKWFRDTNLQPGSVDSVGSPNYQDNNNIGEKTQAANPSCSQDANGSKNGEVG